MSGDPLIPATTYPKIVGRLLAEARKKRGVQQAELAGLREQVLMLQEQMVAASERRRHPIPARAAERASPSSDSAPDTTTVPPRRRRLSFEVATCGTIPRRFREGS